MPRGVVASNHASPGQDRASERAGEEWISSGMGGRERGILIVDPPDQGRMMQGCNGGAAVQVSVSQNGLVSYRVRRCHEIQSRTGGGRKVGVEWEKSRLRDGGRRRRRRRRQWKRADDAEGRSPQEGERDGQDDENGAEGAETAQTQVPRKHEGKACR